MILQLAPAARPLQVGLASRRPSAPPAGDAGLKEFGAEEAKSAKAARGEDDCSDGGGDGARPGHAGINEQGVKEASSDGKEPRKDEPNPPSDRGKGAGDRNPGEALAKIDFSRW
jgi:ATP-binding cassette, subfamily B, bacterial CvaB/MchF/RaxB